MTLTMAEDLVLKNCDLELEVNGRDHHTAELCRERLVVRRGQPFWLTLHFEGRSYEASVDSLTFSAVTGESLHHPLALTCFVISWPPDKGAWGSIPLCPLKSS